MAKRKLSILVFVVCLLLVVSMLCGCNVNLGESNDNDDNDSVCAYKLTVQDPNGYLIENLEDRYEAGEEITVKTNMSHDEDLIVYLDGLSLGSETLIYEKGEYHREFYFKMPSHDAVLSLALSNEFTKDEILLNETTQREIITAFVDLHSKDFYPVAEDEVSLRCFGVFDGVYVLFVDVESWGYTTAIEEDTVAGVRFIYSCGQKMTVYSDGAFYSIAEAYENGILSYDNMLTAQQTYKAAHEFLYTEDI
ncbi:MAG: hypothetical protein J1F65_05560 [Clostridiales bacterium]|nr:hypothetical protein [Clostridiales bacterium]